MATSLDYLPLPSSRERGGSTLECRELSQHRLHDVWDSPGPQAISRHRDGRPQSRWWAMGGSDNVARLSDGMTVAIINPYR